MPNHESIAFTKMHGLGNDFVVINTLTQNVPLANLRELSIATLADRHSGIGFDQLLVISPADNADFYCTIYNADGSEAEQCGNGLRCVARELHEQTLCDNHLTLATKAGVFAVEIENYDAITISMGVPKIEDQLYHFTADLSFSLISIGNPHAILKVDSIQDERAFATAQMVYANKMFPHGINVGLMEILNPRHIALRTLERGTGETLACGSNACAAAAAGILNGWLSNDSGHGGREHSTGGIKVNCQKGTLIVTWPGIGTPIQLTGPAARVYSGKIAI